MRKSKLSTYKQRHLIEHFVAGSTARTAASICNVNHKTVAFYYHRLREIIAYELEQEAEAVFAGEIDVDESYFGGKCKGRCGRGAAGKTPIFGLVKRGGKIYTQVIPNVGPATLLLIIERKVVPDSIVYSDAWHGYNTLAISDFKHYRINHSPLLADMHNYINGIENFWS